MVDYNRDHGCKLHGKLLNRDDTVSKYMYDLDSSANKLNVY